MAATLVNTYTASQGRNTTSLTFTVTGTTAGDVLVFKGGTETGATKLNAPTTTGETWSNWLNVGTTSSTASGRIDTVVLASGGTKTVTVTVAGSVSHSGVVEHWTSAQLAATPATASTTNGGSAPSLSLTTVANGSVVSWASFDWNAVAHGTITYRSSATGEFSAGTAGTDYFAAFAYQTAATAGSQTFGMTAPTGQQPVMVGIEIQSASTGSSFSGSASLSGSGTLTNSGSPKPVQNQALSGSGTVTGAGTPATSGSESGTGAGSLSFGAVPGFSGPFSPSGSGTLSLSGMAVYVGSAALSGAGTVTLGGTPKAVNSTAPSGAGTLALGGTPAPTGSAPLTGSGTLSLSGVAGGGGPAAYSGLVMLTGDGGLSGSGAPAPTGSLSLGGAGFITLSAAGRTMYQFDPPGKQLSMDPTGRDFLWSKVKFFRGDAVIRYTSGAFKQVTTHDPDENGIDTVYLGGHSYTITDSVAAELIQAGYGPYLKVVTS